MVERLLRVFSKEISGIHEVAFLLAASALGSQLLGLFRDRLLSHQFGATGALDVYYAAFKVPDLIFATIASLVSVTVLIPFLSAIASDTAARDTFWRSITTIFFGLIVLVCGIAFFAMPHLAPLLAPGFTTEMLGELVTLSRLLLLSPLLLGLSNLIGSVTQMSGRFILYSVTPLFYNLGIIAGLLLLAPKFGTFGIGIGVVFGAALHFGIQLPYVISSGFGLSLTKNIDWKSVGRVFSLALPRTLGLAAGQLSLLGLTAFGSLMAVGSIAVFNFAYNLQSVPMALVGVSYSVAAFPTLSKLFAEGARDKFFESLKTTARHIVFWSLPVIAIFIVLRAHIVRIILGSGEFNWEHTRLTAAALALFTLSVVAQCLTQLFMRGFYASGHTKIPATIALSSAGATIVSALGLQWFFSNSPESFGSFATLLRVEDISSAEMLILPLAFSIGSVLGVVVLLVVFRSLFKVSLGLTKVFFQSIVAALIAGGIARIVLAKTSYAFDLNRLVDLSAQTLISSIAFALAWLTMLWVLRNPELVEIKNAVVSRISRFGRKEQVPIQPPAEDLQEVQGA